MQDDTTVIQDTNGNDGNPSGDGQPQYSETEKQLYARLKKEEARVKELEGKLGDKAPTIAQPTNTNDIAWRESIELKTDGYSSEEISFIQKNGGKEALNDPFVKSAIERSREDRKVTESVAMNVSSKSAIERKYSPADLQAMSADDMEAVLSGRKR